MVNRKKKPRKIKKEEEERKGSSVLITHLIVQKNVKIYNSRLSQECVTDVTMQNH